jgi:hypothetical protein
MQSSTKNRSKRYTIHGLEASQISSTAAEISQKEIKKSSKNPDKKREKEKDREREKEKEKKKKRLTAKIDYSDVVKANQSQNQDQDQNQNQVPPLKVPKLTHV